MTNKTVMAEENNLKNNEQDASNRNASNNAESEKKENNNRRLRADAAYTINRFEQLQALAEKEALKEQQKNAEFVKSPSSSAPEPAVDPWQTGAKNTKAVIDADSFKLSDEANDEHDLISGLNNILPNNTGDRELWVAAFTNLGGQGFVRKAVRETLDNANAQGQDQNRAPANGDAPDATNPEATRPPEFNPEFTPPQQTESKAHQEQQELEADIRFILSQQAKAVGINGQFGEAFLRKIIPQLTHAVLIASRSNPALARDRVLRTGSQVLRNLYFKHVVNEWEQQIKVVTNYYSNRNCYFNELNYAKNAARGQAPTPKFGSGRSKEDEELELKYRSRSRK